MITTALPHAVETYLAAEKAKDADLLASCFAEDAVVHDEGHVHHGRTAIRKWKSEADAKYKYTMEPLDAMQIGDETTVRARLTGEFPGSPVELNFVFTVVKDKIAALRVHA